MVRGRKPETGEARGVIVSVRLSASEAQRLEAALEDLKVEDLGTDRSTFIRRATMNEVARCCE